MITIKVDSDGVSFSVIVEREDGGESYYPTSFEETVGRVVGVLAHWGNKPLPKTK